MKVQVLRDSKGEVIATFQRTPGELVSVEVEVDKDAKLEEVEVADEYASESDLDALYKQLQRRGK
jgi:hypothetical protein